MTQPTKLAQLRTELRQLLWRRAVVRWGSAVCSLVMWVIWILIAAFLCDWSLDFPLAVRGVALAAWSIAAVWIFNTSVRPLFQQSESLEDAALVVEGHHQIDSDLVAALQFEQPDASHWGSTRLSLAVVDYVAEFSHGLDVFAGFSYRPLPRRLLELCLTSFIVIATTIAFPSHVSAFCNRFLLGSAHYPTSTHLDQIKINGQDVPVFQTSKPTRISVPQGQPIQFEVTCRGHVPLKGIARLTSRHRELNNQLDMNRRTEDEPIFFGGITRALDSFQVRFQFGDAWSDALEIDVVPLPLVDLAWQITPPVYAQQIMKPGESENNSRQSSVLDGSRADLRLTCSNKSLTSVSLKTGNQTIELVPVAAGLKTTANWQLPAGTLFESIHDAIKYEIQVVDQDGLSLPSPIMGQIRLKSDRLPRIVASAVTSHVLPAATPRIDYAAVDDFGIVEVTARLSISREGGGSSQHEIVSYKHQGSDFPEKTVRGQIRLPLAQFELSKGDEIKVVLDVVDWRGDAAGQRSSSETINLNVTDLNGILTQTGEEDKKTAKELDEILRRELGIEGEKK